MAQTKQNQRSANRVSVPVGATGGRTPPSKLTVALLATSVLSAIWAAAMLTPAGRIAYVYVFAYSEFYFGVLALVFLSITVMAGVLATDRMILTVRQRVLLQSAHRTTGIIAVGSLVVHVLTKVSIGHVGIIDAFIPFLSANNTVYVGMGTTAAFFMVSVLWTGLVRARFIGRGKPWMWRSLHSVAYLSWPIALVHGLSAGRAAKTWVLVSYIACIALVLVTLIVRLSVAINRKKDFASSPGTGTGSIKPVGKLVPTAPPSAKSRPPERQEPLRAPRARRRRQRRAVERPPRLRPPRRACPRPVGRAGPARRHRDPHGAPGRRRASRRRGVPRRTGARAPLRRRRPRPVRPRPRGERRWRPPPRRPRPVQRRPVRRRPVRRRPVRPRPVRRGPLRRGTGPSAR